MTIEMPHEGSEKELTRKLAQDGHLNVLERRMLPGQRVRASVLSEVICDSLAETGWFPAEMRPTENCPIELIQRLSAGNCVIHQTVECGVGRHAKLPDRIYDSLSTAAAAYVKLFWPSNIDGIPIDHDA